MRDVLSMRTTLNIDDDVLDTVKAMASRDRKPVGEVVSAMLRRALEPSVQAVLSHSKHAPRSGKSSGISSNK